MSIKFILGRADKDFHKYMYDRIACQMAEDTKNILILVPDQFTLQAERIAFEYLKVEGLIGVEVLSFSRLAHRILDEVGGTSKIHINEHGKHMILYKIISESKENLEVFKNVATKHGFIDILNEFITELKQFNIGHKELKAIANEIEDNKILKKKLQDTGFIYEKLHGYLENKFIDSEDFINLLIEKAEMSFLLKDAVIWVDGFDYFNPQTILLLEKLMLLAKEVNINFLLDDSIHVGDKDVFEVSKYSMSRCAEIAERNNLSYDTICLSND
ncbi:MAG: ATP-dependent helicase/deoxyribonuclease subunit B, partial [Clostridiales bacterium]|nr:ATP-dependent helicase/deoxyribonuclease subunit B [Clostridiales bacterium]